MQPSIPASVRPAPTFAAAHPDAAGPAGAEGAHASSADAPASAPCQEESRDSHFECNVCLDVASNPVITRCGHLYCWPCLFRWLDGGHGTCPVCKAGVSRDNVIPLYTRGREPRDPRDSSSAPAAGGAGAEDTLPQRPAAERPAVAAAGAANDFGIGQWASLLGLQFQSFIDSQVGATNARLTQEEQQAATLVKVLYAVGGGILLALLFL